MSDAPNAKPSATDTVEKGESLWVGAWHRLRKNKMALAGGVFILLLAGLSFIGPFFLEGDYYTNTILEDKLTAPGGEYTLGTDHLGRDQLGRIIRAAKSRCSSAWSPPSSRSLSASATAPSPVISVEKWTA